MTREPIPACQVADGECFRKVTGEFAYRRFSESSVRFLGLPPDKVYGLAYNGNVAVVAPGTPVVVVGDEVVAANRRSEADWNALVGAKD